MRQSCQQQVKCGDPTYLGARARVVKGWSPSHLPCCLAALPLSSRVSVSELGQLGRVYGIIWVLNRLACVPFGCYCSYTKAIYFPSTRDITVSFIRVRGHIHQVLMTANFPCVAKFLASTFSLKRTTRFWLLRNLLISFSS